MASTVAHSTASPADIKKFSGGKGFFTKALGLGVVGLAVALAGIAVAPQQAFYSYLVAFAYWAGIGFASLILLMIFHAFRAKWPTVVRRPLETIASSLWVFLLLFIPIVLGLKQIYFKWAAPVMDSLTHEEQHLLHHKAPYLNTTFFIIRGAFYILFAWLIGSRFFRLSTKQDQSGDPQLTAKARATGVAMLPFFALAFSFASFDWMMSLEPLWFSTIFGVYYFAGSILSTMAILIIATVWGRGSKDSFGTWVTVEHLHNLGKLLFAFTAFWAYIAVSQFLLIWIANLPEETPFFLVRMRPEWAPVGIFLIIGHFFLPFGILLSRDIKRNPRRLIWVAFWALFVHLVDIYWLIVPTLSPEKPLVHWTLPFAVIGVGFTAIALVVARIRGHYAVPVKDPYLAVSLRYKQP